MKRTSIAVWIGTLKAGKGLLSSESGTLNEIPYSFVSRFEKGSGTNPEELLAAAHAGCFTMALSAKISITGKQPEKLTTQATVTIEQVQGNFAITSIHLRVVGKVPEMEIAEWDALTKDAKANCPVSRVLNTNITMEATLES